MFQEVERRYPGTFIGYLNADILFGPDLIITLQAILGYITDGILKQRVLIIGKRTNCKMDGTVTFPSAEDYPRWLKQFAANGNF